MLCVPEVPTKLYIIRKDFRDVIPIESVEDIVETYKDEKGDEGVAVLHGATRRMRVRRRERAVECTEPVNACTLSGSMHSPRNATA